VSVVIPTRRPWDEWSRSIPLLTSDPVVSEIIVVDDRAGNVECWSVRYADARVRVVRGGRAGPSAARQAGLEATAGDIVLLLDDDVIPSPGLATAHARRHRVPSLVVVGYMPVPDPPGSKTEPVTRMLYRHEYAARIETYERDHTMILRHLWSGNVSMRREDAMRVGLASPTFRGRRHEDRELGLRCLAAGMAGVFDRSLLADHDYERSTEVFLEDARAQGAERVALHRLHADLIGPFDAGTFASGLPAAARLFVRACRRPSVERLATTGLSVAVALATKGGWRRAAIGSLKLARRIQQQAGAREAAREFAAAESP
jgi:glycosyltransferase involved in cell wall biosynthesis